MEVLSTVINFEPPAIADDLHKQTNAAISRLIEMYMTTAKLRPRLQIASRCLSLIRLHLMRVPIMGSQYRGDPGISDLLATPPFAVPGNVAAT